MNGNNVCQATESFPEIHENNLEWNVQNCGNYNIFLATCSEILVYRGMYFDTKKLSDNGHCNVQMCKSWFGTTVHSVTQMCNGKNLYLVLLHCNKVTKPCALLRQFFL